MVKKIQKEKVNCTNNDDKISCSSSEIIQGTHFFFLPEEKNKKSKAGSQIPQLLIK